MYVRMYVCMYVYICMYVCTYVCMFVFVFFCKLKLLYLFTLVHSRGGLYRELSVLLKAAERQTVITMNELELNHAKKGSSSFQCKVRTETGETE